MKAKLLLIILAAVFSKTFAQNLIVNGSLENNTASGNTVDLHDWSTIVSNAWEVDGGAMDLLTSNSCGGASNGNWFVETSHNGFDYYTAFSLGLSAPLTIGNQYTLSFDKKVCSVNSAAIDIGLSNDSTLMGTIINTFSAPTLGTWVSETFIFTASTAARFLTVNLQTSLNNSQVDLDNFVLTQISTGINELSLENLTIYPNPGNGLFSVFLNNVQKAEVSIYNNIGERIYSIQPNSNKVEIDLRKEAKGIYFYSVTNEKGIVGQGKFIVQ